MLVCDTRSYVIKESKSMATARNVKRWMPLWRLDEPVAKIDKTVKIVALGSEQDE